jgi:hypothetical protein
VDDPSLGEASFLAAGLRCHDPTTAAQFRLVEDLDRDDRRFPFGRPCPRLVVDTKTERMVIMGRQRRAFTTRYTDEAV